MLMHSSPLTWDLRLMGCWEKSGQTQVCSTKASLLLLQCCNYNAKPWTIWCPILTHQKQFVGNCNWWFLWCWRHWRWIWEFDSVTKTLVSYLLVVKSFDLHLCGSSVVIFIMYTTGTVEIMHTKKKVVQRTSRSFFQHLIVQSMRW